MALGVLGPCIIPIACIWEQRPSTALLICLQTVSLREVCSHFTSGKPIRVLGSQTKTDLRSHPSSLLISLVLIFANFPSGQTCHHHSENKVSRWEHNADVVQLLQRRVRKLPASQNSDVSSHSFMLEWSPVCGFLWNTCPFAAFVEFDLCAPSAGAWCRGKECFWLPLQGGLGSLLGGREPCSF